MALTTIVVGCDLSPPSDAALDRAAALAAAHRARLVLVHALADEPPPGPRHTSTSHGAWRNVALATLPSRKRASPV